LCWTGRFGSERGDDMAIIQVEIPEALWERLRATGRPIGDVVIEALETSFQSSTPADPPLSKAEIIQRLIDAGVVKNPDAWSDSFLSGIEESSDEDDEEAIHETAETYSYDNLASTIVIRNRLRLDEDLSSSQVRQRLLERGLVRDPKDWDTPATRRWEQLTEAEQAEFIDEMNGMFLAGSPASTIITENRR
jgi:hypothetical protein